MADIGYYTLPVILSFKGIDQQVNDALGKTLDQTVPKQIKKSVDDKISKQIEASSKTVGKKIGTQLNTAINPQQVGKDIGTKLNTGITKAIDPKKVGTEVSKQVAQGFDPKPIGKRIEQGLVLAQNLDTKKIGKTISDNMAGGIDVKHVGSVLKDVLREPLNDAKQVAKDWGKQVGNEILSGNVKKAATDIGDVVTNTTTGINNLGKVVGVNLDGVEKFGTDAAKTIDTVGTTVQGVVDKIPLLKTLGENIGQIGSGDTATRLQGVAGSLQTIGSITGTDLSGISKPVGDLAGESDKISTLAGSLQGLSKIGRIPIYIALIVEGMEDVIKVSNWLHDHTDPTKAGSVAAQVHDELVKAGIISPTGGVNEPPKPAIPTIGLPAPGQPPPPGAFVQPPVPGPGGKPPPTPTERVRRWFEGEPPPAAVPNMPQQGPGGETRPGLQIPGQPPLVRGEPTLPGVPIPIPGLQPARPAQPPGAPAPGTVGPTTGPTTAASANVTASTASVNIGSATISGVSIPSPGAPASTSSKFTTGQAGKWFQTGGSVFGPGGTDNVPIMATAGEHMLTVADVAKMGGHAGVYAFRNALHRDDGGKIHYPSDPDQQPGAIINPRTGDVIQTNPDYYGGNPQAFRDIFGANQEAWNAFDAAKGRRGPGESGGGRFNPNVKLDTSIYGARPVDPAAGRRKVVMDWLRQTPILKDLLPGLPHFDNGGDIPGGIVDWATPGRGGMFNPNVKLDPSIARPPSLGDKARADLRGAWMNTNIGLNKLGLPSLPDWIPHFDEGGEIKQLGEAIAAPVAKAAAEGAAKGAEGAAHGAGAGMALPAILGGPGGQQMGADIATSLLGIGAGGVGETLGLGTMFPDPMQNPNVKSLIALASAFKGPIMGAMKGKLGIQQPGWKPGMSVAAMAGDTGAGASIGLPFGLPSIDLPNAPEGGAAPPGGGPVGGGDTNIDASLTVHGDVGNEKALRDHQQQMQRGLDRLAPMPTGPN